MAEVVRGQTELYPFESNFFERGPSRLHYLDEARVSRWSWSTTLVSFYYRDVARSLRETIGIVLINGCGYPISREMMHITTPLAPVDDHGIADELSPSVPQPIS